MRITIFDTGGVGLVTGESLGFEYHGVGRQ